MNSAIHQASFSIIKENLTKQYDLTIHFLDENKETLSSKIFTFSEDSSISEKKGILIDIFTKNGNCNVEAPIEGLFTGKDIQELKKAKKFKRASAIPSIMVLDLKDDSLGYKDPNNTIPKCESAVCEFFKQSSPTCKSKSAKTIHSHLINVDFILLEGSLKKDLLEKGGFTIDEATHLNSNKGSIQFCQIAEFFMNGFKFGQIAKGNEKTFSAQSYIKPLSKKFETFHPCKTSTVLYPPLYQDTYAQTGNFAKTLSPVFSITGHFCEQTKITQLNFEEK